MAIFTHRPVSGSDTWAQFFGDAQSMVLTSVSSTKAVFDSGDFIVELSGTGLALGPRPAGAITGAKLLLVDLSATGGTVEVLSGTRLSVPFASLMNAYANDPLGPFDLLFAGNDTVNGSADADQLFGGAGNDVIKGGDGDDVLFGGFGDFESSDGNDTMDGGNGHDTLFGEGGNDSMRGGAGNDVLYGDAGSDTMAGGTGNDLYFVERAGDRVIELAGQGANDRVEMMASATFTAYALPANVENLSIATPYSFSFPPTTPPTVTAKGNALANKIIVQLQESFDDVSQPQSPVRLEGLGGNDRLVGAAGNDRLDGGAGNDKLIGGAGNDMLIGGVGADRLTGGAGADRFVFSDAAMSDTISDFVTAADKLAFSQAGMRIGNGDTTINGPVSKATGGGFAGTAELVIISGNISGSITTSSAAAKIGSATSAYAVGRKALFAVDNGADSALYLFTAADANAAVSATELKLVATLTGSPSTAISDYLFVG